MKIAGTSKSVLLSRLLLALLLPVADTVTANSAQVDSASRREWQFQVTLDGEPIGSHSFQLTNSGEETRVISEARYEVRWLFFTAYEYRHSAEEIWRDGCLMSISSRTRDGDKRIRVSGRPDEKGMLIRVNDQGEVLSEPCIRSFAYWDVSLLRDRKLLNPQTGELEPVELTSGEMGPPEWLGFAATSHYRLTTSQMPIHLWYDDRGRWLGLEAELESGRVLRYRPLPITNNLPLSGEDS